MSPFKVAFGIGDLAMAALVAGLSVPLIMEKVPMNAWYGVRLAKSFASDANWYAINRYGGKVLLGYALALALVGAIVLAGVVPARLPWLLVVALAPLILLVPVLVPIVRFARRLPG